MNNKFFRGTPWDEAIYGLPTWELKEYSEEAIRDSLKIGGHYTVKVDPLADKSLLHEYGFYYCDTLIEPSCDRDRLIVYSNEKATTSYVFDGSDASQMLAMSQSAFKHGRFHRDFFLDPDKANKRYEHWLDGLISDGQVKALFWQKCLAGFIAQIANNLVLHAISYEFRGRGHAKYWWSEVSLGILDAGFTEVKSSISAANVKALNLYASLGYRFGSPVDVYHKLVE